MTAERDVKADIRLDAHDAGAVLFNNPVGVAIVESGARVRYGLVPGAADLVGWATVTVTPDMVGQRVAVFTAIETKSKRGRAREDQENFIDAVRAAGGRAGIARTVEDARKIIKGAA